MRVSFDHEQIKQVTDINNVGRLVLTLAENDTHFQDSPVDLMVAHEIRKRMIARIMCGGTDSSDMEELVNALADAYIESFCFEE